MFDFAKQSAPPPFILDHQLTQTPLSVLITIIAIVKQVNQVVGYVDESLGMSEAGGRFMDEEPWGSGGQSGGGGGFGNGCSWWTHLLDLT